MDCEARNQYRQGAALLVVLFVVMAITVLSLGFIARSDVELACGENMVVQARMDYLAESGLEQAKGLILRPQEVDDQYWAGAEAQQLFGGGSSEYYDVTVVRDDSDALDRCNYDISCEAYRLQNGQKVARSRLEASLRLDPCIALWCGSGWASQWQSHVNGDVFCDGSVSGLGYVDGDVFACGTITQLTVAGRRNEVVTEPPVSWPGVSVSNFSTSYYIGSVSYGSNIVDSNVHPVGSFGYTAENPAGVRYYGGDLKLPGAVTIDGMLVVSGTLTVAGPQNVVRAVKNFPALVVGGEVVLESGGQLAIEGLAQVGERILFAPGAENAWVSVLGGLFIGAGSINGLTSDSCSLEVTAAPALASIEVWPAADDVRRWSPMAGAFYRKVEKVEPGGI